MMPGMTNHPGRRRDDEEPSAAAPAELAAEVPAVAEMASEMAAAPPPQVPPGFSPNGGKTPMTALVEQLPQMLFNAVAQALSSVQVRTAPLKCATCTLARAAWFGQHAAEIATAEAAYRAAWDALPEGDPRRGLIRAVS